ncbi:MAG: pyruvate kinase [Ndongobacter sp.]|nr:pyruvate kinase [Ndongobacter sp.]
MNYYATLGPSCMDEETLLALMDFGMTGLRYNLAHGSLRAIQPVLQSFQKKLRQERRSLRFLIDLEGAKLRIGRLDKERLLREGEYLDFGENTEIPVPEELISCVAVGDRINLDDNKLLAEVVSKASGGFCAHVLRGGALSSRKTIKIEGKEVPLSILTESDRENLSLLRECGIGEIMVPFCERVEDLEEIRRSLDEADAPRVRLFAKIETPEGVARAEELADHCDVLVIARGDLGNAFPLCEVPRLQKKLAEICRAKKRPFLVVTQLLDSMIDRPVPTRAEVSDIYNAVLDGCSYLMLTGETAVGAHPGEAMRWLVQTGRTAQRDLAERGLGV